MAVSHRNGSLRMTTDTVLLQSATRSLPDLLVVLWSLPLPSGLWSVQLTRSVLPATHLDLDATNCPQINSH